MRLRGIHLAGYRLPLSRPLAVRASAGMVREGALLMVESRSGAPGIGDIAPLPGVSRESLSEAVEDVRREMRRWGDRDLLADELLAGAWFPEDAVCSSARFAIESALLGAMAAEAGLSLGRIFSDGMVESVRVNGLLDGDPGGWADQALSLLEDGVAQVKIKVGRDAWPREADALRRVEDAVAGRLRFRLDANRAWSLDEFLRFADAVDGLPVEYVEEPLRDPEELADAISRTGLGVALDESLYDRPCDCLADYPGAVAAVLKPSRLGGLVPAWNRARTAVDRGMAPVISSLFESGVGLRALAQLAAGLGDPETAHGLDTARWFAEDVVEPAFVPSRGRVGVSSEPDSLLILNRNVVRDIG